jgi:nicotinate-nucleotide pyrophosphorylase (carboxylating)
LKKQPNNPAYGLDLDEVIELALREDIGDGDVTSLSIFTKSAQGTARLLVKDHGILAGVPVAEKVFHKLDPSLELNIFKQDGEKIVPKDIVFEVRGNILSIITAERLVLNFMQRLSGIATTTHNIVSLVSDLHARILDTRKTTPNLRDLEKYAVRMGGGLNHRMGLYDMVLIKDNHVDFAGGIIPAITSVRDYLVKTGKTEMKVEIEVRNLEELREVVSHGQVDRILLDNFTPETLAEAVAYVSGRFKTEASGGITATNVRKYAETGVDFISIGALTHNFRSLDLSLKAVTTTHH